MPHEYVNLGADTIDLRPSVDVLIAGGGICGLAVAYALKEKYPRATVAILEAEDALGEHASGRNSGVLHAGIYYDSSSLKARFCREGSLRMQEFCREYDLPLVNSGKLIVPSGGANHADLLRLKAKADANGVRTELIGGQRLLEIEPSCGHFSAALYSPDTASVDPRRVLTALEWRLRSAGVKIFTGQRILSIDPATKTAKTKDYTVSYGAFINCAGSGSLDLAKHFGLGENLALLPFRGSYYEIKPRCISGRVTPRVNGNIYPVPDPRFPVLGVHVSRAVSGTMYAGPSAWPLFSISTFGILADEYLTNRGGMRRHMHQELRNRIKLVYFHKVKELLPHLRMDELQPSKKWGIRAQLYDLQSKKLVTDFLVEDAKDSLHVLNMISPGFTCAFSFADYVVERLTASKGAETSR